jgi:hypothetical protein
VLPHVELVNAYGPTEATVYITHHTFDKSEKHMRPTISIGKPLTNSKCYVVDRKNVSCFFAATSLSKPTIILGPDRSGISHFGLAWRLNCSG